jgi:hypothetical protein
MLQKLQHVIHEKPPNQKTTFLDMITDTFTLQPLYQGKWKFDRKCSSILPTVWTCPFGLPSLHEGPTLKK